MHNLCTLNNKTFHSGLELLEVLFTDKDDSEISEDVVKDNDGGDYEPLPYQHQVNDSNNLNINEIPLSIEDTADCGSTGLISVVDDITTAALHGDFPSWEFVDGNVG